MEEARRNASSWREDDVRTSRTSRCRSTPRARCAARRPADDRHHPRRGPGTARDLERPDLALAVRDDDDRSGRRRRRWGGREVDVGHGDRTGPARAHRPRWLALRPTAPAARGGASLRFPTCRPRPHLRAAGRAAFGRLPGGMRSRILRAVGERAGIAGSEIGLVTVVVVAEPGDRVEESLASVRGQSHGLLEAVVCPVGPATAGCPTIPASGPGPRPTLVRRGEPGHRGRGRPLRDAAARV